MDDRTIDAALRDLTDRIDWPDPVDLSARIRLNGPVSRPWTHRLAWATGVLMLIAGIVSVPATRQAVANLLEVAGIRFEFGRSTTLPPPTDLAVGQEVDLDVARAGVDFPILLPTALEPPAVSHLLLWELGTQVFLAWEASERLPEVGDSGIGLLLAEFRADLDQEFFGKMVLEGTTVDRVLVNGRPGFWLAGSPHVFMFRSDDQNLVGDESRLTGNVLVWEDDGVTYRLESSLSMADSLAIAESLSP
ncbi:MAG: hypothetical protein ACRDWH_07960 [Acidimicrobiia bacterium]